MEEPTTSTSTKVKQLTHFESRDCVRVQDINVPLALRAHRLVGEMILNLSLSWKMKASPTF